MAIVDREGPDRASIGQIFCMLDGANLDVLKQRWRTGAEFGPTELKRAKDTWDKLLNSTAFQECRKLRHGTAAHNLMDPLPEVWNEAFFAVLDDAEDIVMIFYGICGYGKPDFLGNREDLKERARLFWDTYFKGMGI